MKSTAVQINEIVRGITKVLITYNNKHVNGRTLKYVVPRNTTRLAVTKINKALKQAGISVRSVELKATCVFGHQYTSIFVKIPL